MRKPTNVLHHPYKLLTPHLAATFEGAIETATTGLGKELKKAPSYIYWCLL